MTKDTIQRSAARFGRSAALWFGACIPVAAASGGDWPMWGHDASRCNSSAEIGLPDSWDVGKHPGRSGEIDLSATRNVKWIARLGSESYGNPTVAGGRVYVGTNNDAHRDPRLKGDRSNLYCLDEESGELRWKLSVPKLGTGMVSDWERVGICSSASVEGDRVYLVTNRCEVMCLDAGGLADGNDGSFQDEGRYMAGPGAEPFDLVATDADILWVLDMLAECGVQPHNITSSSVLIAGDRLWVTTSNGIDVDHSAVPAPRAPCLILVDKASGRLLAEEASGVSARLFHGNWSSPASLSTDDQELCIFGGPDGYCYAFSPEVVEREDGPALLQEIWRVDCNPPECRRPDGEPLPYSDLDGPSEVLATPAVYEGRVYCVIGQEPGASAGPGNLCCIDAAGEMLWSYGEIHRSMSSLAIGDGLLFAADYSGFVYCLDARTGKELWIHDTMGQTWGSPLLADGRVYLGNEDGYVTILPARREYSKQAVIEIDMQSAVYSSAIAANGVLYIATPTHLFALQVPEDSGE